MFQSLDSLMLPYGKLITMLLVFTRIFSVFYLAPVFGSNNIPPKVRVFLSVVVTVIIYPLVNQYQVKDMDMLSLTFIILKELGVGFVLGYAGMIVFSVLRFVGDFVESLIGMSDAGMIDPLYNEEVGALGQLQFIIFIIIFLIFNGHHFIINLIARSFEVVPIGDLVITGPLINKITAMVGQIFVYGVKYTSPILAFIIITIISFGIMGKAVPDMNLLIVMIPAKIFIGLMGFIVMFPFLVYFINFLIKELYRDLNMILHLV